MAAQLEETQRRLIQTELLETIRDEKLVLINRAAAGAARRQALNEKEWAEVTATVNKLLLGRDAWLKQMREASMRRQRIAELTIEEERRLNEQVDVLLRDPAQRNSVANVKYESDNVPDAAPKNATGFDGVLQGMLSKLTGALGDGPFAFIGKLLTQIFSFIFPMISAFKEMGKKTTADLIKEGSLEEADAELTMQENELINKISTTIPKIPETKDVYDALAAYQEELKKLKEVKFVDNKGAVETVSFAETTKSYQTNILASRLKIFNELSSKTAAPLAVHEELVTAQAEKTAWERQRDGLAARRGDRVTCPKGSVESKLLKVRINAIQTEMAALEAKRVAAVEQEARFLADMAAETKHIQDLFAQNAALSVAEAKRQKDLDAKTKADAGKAVQEAKDKYEAEKREKQQAQREQRDREDKIRAEAARDAQAQREHEARMKDIDLQAKKMEVEKAKAETEKARVEAVEAERVRAAAHVVVPPPSAAPAASAM